MAGRRQAAENAAADTGSRDGADQHHEPRPGAWDGSFRSVTGGGVSGRAAHAQFLVAGVRAKRDL